MASTERGLNHETIDRIFSFHPPISDEVAAAHDEVRQVLRDAAHRVKDLTPVCPEQTVAIRKMQEAMMHANAAIAIYQETETE